MAAMRLHLRRAVLGALAAVPMLVAGCVLTPPEPDRYETAIAVFKDAGASSRFFDSSYGYAIFPTIGEGAFGLGGARGNGRVYVQGVYAGDVTMSQLSLGFQVGAQAYREIIFFEDERALREFISGDFEFGAETAMIFVSIGATASAGSFGATAAAGHRNDPLTAGGYRKGMAVFAATKGGGMIKLSVAGQKFHYEPRALGTP
jgi:lipid-binding SYLF domain-containing protein